MRTIVFPITVAPFIRELIHQKSFFLKIICFKLIKLLTFAIDLLKKQLINTT